MAFQTTNVTLDMGKEDVVASSLAVLEHCMVFPPKYASIEYNMGLGILFRSIRQVLDIEEPEGYENENM